MSDTIKFHDYDVLVAPILTEKSLSDESGAIHVFKVQTKSTKTTIKKAVENVFNVKTEEVRVLNIKGKSKTFKNKQGKQSDWKKAYVRLASGYEIDYSKYNKSR